MNEWRQHSGVTALGACTALGDRHRADAGWETTSSLDAVPLARPWASLLTSLSKGTENGTSYGRWGRPVLKPFHSNIQTLLLYHCSDRCLSCHQPTRCSQPSLRRLAELRLCPALQHTRTSGGPPGHCRGSCPRTAARRARGSPPHPPARPCPAAVPASPPARPCPCPAATPAPARPTLGHTATAAPPPPRTHHPEGPRAVVGLQRHLQPVVLGAVLVHLGAALLHLLPRRRRHRLLRLLPGTFVLIVFVVIVMALLGLLLIWKQSGSRDWAAPGAPPRPARAAPRPRSPRSFLPMAAARRAAPARASLPQGSAARGGDTIVSLFPRPPRRGETRGRARGGASDTGGRHTPGHARNSGK